MCKKAFQICTSPYKDMLSNVSTTADDVEVDHSTNMPTKHEQGCSKIVHPTRMKLQRQTLKLGFAQFLARKTEILVFRAIRTTPERSWKAAIVEKLERRLHPCVHPHTSKYFVPIEIGK